MVDPAHATTSFEQRLEFETLISDISASLLATPTRPRDPRFYLYPGEGVWTNPFIEGRYDFLLDGVRLLDSRIYMHFYATGITPAMAIKNVGVGSQYAIAYLDKEGNALDGSKTYRIHLPPNVPAKDFWSFTLYDSQTRSMLQTDERFPGLDNTQDGPQPNADGSYDIYFGPVAPSGMERNWIQTVPGKGWNALRPAAALLRQDLAAGRPRAGRSVGCRRQLT